MNHDPAGSGSPVSVRKQLQEIEQSTGLRYPLSFVSMLGEFSELLDTPGFRNAFPDTSLLLSVAEIAAARDTSPDTLLPFMRQEEPEWPVIYVFDCDTGQAKPRVAVWSDHAIVMDWESFPAFLQWVHEHIDKHKSSG